MDLWSVLFGVTITIEAVLILNLIGCWKEGDDEGCYRFGSLTAYIFAVYVLAANFGLTVGGFLTVVAVTLAYYFAERLITRNFG